MGCVINFYDSIGAADDLAKATDIARSMVMQYGMYEPLGHVVFEPQHLTFLEVPIGMPQERSYSEETAKEIDRAIRGLMNDAFKKSVAILKEHAKQLKKGAELLLQQETLSEEDLSQLVKTPK